MTVFTRFFVTVRVSMPFFITRRLKAAETGCDKDLEFLRVANNITAVEKRLWEGSPTALTKGNLETKSDRRERDYNSQPGDFEPFKDIIHQSLATLALSIT